MRFAETCPDWSESVLRQALFSPDCQRVCIQSIESGGQVWEFRSGCVERILPKSPWIGSWSPEGDRVIYVGCGLECLYTLELCNGEILWRRKLDVALRRRQRMFSAPVIGADGTVYAGAASGLVLALEGASGEVRWTYPANCKLDSSFAMDIDGSLYFCTAPGYGIDGKYHRACVVALR